MNENNTVLIATDGACKGNPGPGGYGVVLIYGQHRREMSCGYGLTTNNRMEMLAVIIALETLKRQCDVRILSDSKYIIDNVRGGFPWKWRDKGWVLSSKKPAKNADLWERMINLIDFHEVIFEWVKGHSGHELNELADTLASDAAEQERSLLLFDDGFEG
jgi:ribonuclease HI